MKVLGDEYKVTVSSWQDVTAFNRKSLEAPRLESWFGDDTMMHLEIGSCENTLHASAEKDFKGGEGSTRFFNLGEPTGQREARTLNRGHPILEYYLNGKNKTWSHQRRYQWAAQESLPQRQNPVFLNFTSESCYNANSDSEVLG